MENETTRDIKTIVNTENGVFALIKTDEGKTCCEECVFSGGDFGCKLERKEPYVDKKYAHHLLALCLQNAFYHWENYKELDVMEKKKKVTKGEFDLVKTANGVVSCACCAFGNNGKCKLIRHQTDIDAEEENEMYRICQLNAQTHWEVKHNIPEKEDDSEAEQYADSFFEPHEIEDEHANISSTGGGSPVNDAPSNGTPSKPKVLSGDTIRNVNIQITLNEAREMYFSHNPTLKTMACSAFTPAEIEDVRRCTMNVDLQTAKRLYRNAETAVRDFVLSAFSKEELED